ncbi:extracellular catalytic domain type 1 short-chain-length polyhydroxyalkanoate depolymerase [Paracoccus benzoatiresistens]|uniref:PHB depolymerase family esterase n=1 Tax=Paracoccus benzoatiresistens TaxID=2997341 RepID=A0ABT4J0Q4_9RHOB|nr:PHB depolymerase family esterase [Paracoccus sp. EF6]MCZ0960673.1 PHB depolymerase family esterase [Paracoccus sp. EF6]
MKPLDMGALRRAMDGLRLEGASDLVQRTLARHGLTMPGGQAGFEPPFTAPSAAPVSDSMPSGASFKADRFTCAAGSREYMTYVPASAPQGIRGMVLMLHGCTQTHADFARGTGMNALAEEHRLIVVYPQQCRGENAQSCWNWFSPGDQRPGRGEPEILAQMVLDVAARHRVPQDRIFVAGLSAGAAMAVILGQTHPRVFAAVGAHSGLPFGAARDVPSAFAAMGGGAADASARRGSVPTPTIVFHGSADRTVHPSNGERIAADTLAAGPEQTVLDQTTGKAGKRAYRREITTALDGRVLLDHWVVEGLGHAWSGGRPGGSYTDLQGPDASAEMVRFFLGQPGTERPGPRR